MSDLYTKEILRLTLQIPRLNRLENPDQTIHRRSRICGSSLELDVKLSPLGAIEDFGWEIKACALGQAAAAVIGAKMIGMTKDRTLDLKYHMDEMLRDGNLVDWSDVLDGDFAAMKHLQPASGHLGRLGAIYLPVDGMLQIWR